VLFGAWNREYIFTVTLWGCTLRKENPTKPNYFEANFTYIWHVHTSEILSGRKKTSSLQHATTERYHSRTKEKTERSLEHKIHNLISTTAPFFLSFPNPRPRKKKAKASFHHTTTTNHSPWTAPDHCNHRTIQLLAVSEHAISWYQL
jgi:hypothetical protein